MDITFFDFEADFVATLRCVPMIVRFKLDVVGIKLSLRAWSRFSVATRTRLAMRPVDSTQDAAHYRAFLIESIEALGETVAAVADNAQPSWINATSLPEVVANKLAELKLQLNGHQKWSQLSALQRFTLVKLTRGGHENANFMPALREFGMVV